MAIPSLFDRISEYYQRIDLAASKETVAGKVYTHIWIRRRGLLPQVPLRPMSSPIFKDLLYTAQTNPLLGKFLVRYIRHLKTHNKDYFILHHLAVLHNFFYNLPFDKLAAKGKKSYFFYRLESAIPKHRGVAYSIAAWRQPKWMSKIPIYEIDDDSLRYLQKQFTTSAQNSSDLQSLTYTRALATLLRRYFTQHPPHSETHMPHSQLPGCSYDDERSASLPSNSSSTPP